MPQAKVGREKVQRKSMCFEPSDFRELESISKELGLSPGEASPLVRAFIRLYRSFGPIVKPLLMRVVSENDRVYAVSRTKIGKKKASEILKKAGIKK